MNRKILNEVDSTVIVLRLVEEESDAVLSNIANEVSQIAHRYGFKKSCYCVGIVKRKAK